MTKKKIIVIKYGGSLMDDENAENKILKYIKKVARKNPVVVVHGGGKEITQALKRANIKTKFVNGLRYTDVKSIKIVERILEKIQKQIAQKLKNAVAVKKIITGQRVKKLGYVGRFNYANISEIKKIVLENKIAVIAPLGRTKNNQLLNFNADEIASGIATQLKAKKLVFFTNVNGVINNNNKTIPTIKKENIKKLIDKKIITGGMIPKIQGCLKAVKNGVSEVDILGLNFNGTRIL